MKELFIRFISFCPFQEGIDLRNSGKGLNRITSSSRMLIGKFSSRQVCDSKVIYIAPSRIHCEGLSSRTNIKISYALEVIVHVLENFSRTELSEHSACGMPYSTTHLGNLIFVHMGAFFPRQKKNTQKIGRGKTFCLVVITSFARSAI